MATRLHHERLGDGAATMLFTHGIFGAGGNWRTIARAVLGRCPGWSALLVDLRLHGRSDDGAPPHTVAACADDLAALCAGEAAAGRPVRIAIGHSFGGKAVLALRGTGAALAQTWMLDSSPSARPGAWEAEGNEVRGVWDSLTALADRAWARRDDFIVALERLGHARALAAWLAMSLVPADGGLRLRFDLPAIRDLVLDYLARELWPTLVDPALAGDVHVVVATRSDTIATDVRARLAALPSSARVQMHPVDAGHWLHLDAPAAVVDLLASHVPPP